MPQQNPRGGEPRAPPTGTLLLKDIGKLATLNAQLGDIDDAAVYIQGNVIAWVGKTADIPVAYREADTVLSLPDRVITPGLVNTHHHMYQSLTRVIAQDDKLFGWLTSLYPVWNLMTGEDAYISAKLSMVELLWSGCTTSSDHLYVYPNDVTLDDTIRAARDVGMRFHPTRGAMSFGKSKGGLPPDEQVEDEEKVLADMRRLIEEYHDPNRYSMLRMGLAPCSPFSVSTELMASSANLAREYPAVRLHTHLAENQEDIDYSMKMFNCRPGEYIKRVGWDRDDCWFAHCCCLDEQEIKMFADRGVGISHCPSSNLRLGSGIAPIRQLIDAKVKVGLGVDGSASNDSAHVISEARLAMLLQRSRGMQNGLTVREGLLLATKGGASNLGRDDIAEVAPGFAADLAAWRTDGISFAGAQHDVVGALLLCTAGLDPCDLVVINGQIIVKDGQFVNLDVKDLVKQHNERSKRIVRGVEVLNREGSTALGVAS